ncbi:hypothetical protein GGR58DRAFT_504693 [Xylaria digitata]|nr:hypothetical protein GGR58DRAFT_504693 [Xylaria digitata]
MSRLEVVVGGISKPNLGLLKDIWDHLSNVVDLVIHNGAQNVETGVPETDDLDGSRKGLGTGYGQPKWASEFLVGAHPDISNTINAVPVTQVSRIIVAAALHLPATTGQLRGVAQVTSHPRLMLNDLIGALELYGYDTPIAPYQEWSTKVIEYMNDGKKEEHALLPLSVETCPQTLLPQS